MAVTSTTPSSGSIFGGFTITVTGGGFPAQPPLDGTSRLLVWTGNSTWSSTTWPMGMPVLRLVSSTGSTMTLSVDRMLPASPAAAAAAQAGSVNYQLTSMPPGTTPDSFWRFGSFRASITLDFRRQWTPAVVSADFGGCGAAGTACQVSVNWTLPSGSSQGVTRPPAGTPGQAVVELQAAGSSGSIVRCENATIVANSIGSNSYNESLLCSLPGNVTAGNYSLWVCWGGRGCGGAAGPVLAASVLSVSPAAGSGAGGTNVTISGAGRCLRLACLHLKVTWGLGQQLMR